MQLGDLALAEAKLLGQDLVGMLAQSRTPRVRALNRAELVRRAGHQIAADARLLDFLEQRVGRRASWVFLDHLGEGLVRPPADIVLVEGGAHLGQRVGRAPRADQVTDRFARFETVFLAGEVCVDYSLRLKRERVMFTPDCWRNSK